MDNEKVYQMPFAKVYPLLVNKALRKGRTQAEVDEIIAWLTGYETVQPDKNQRLCLWSESGRDSRAFDA